MAETVRECESGGDWKCPTCESGDSALSAISAISPSCSARGTHRLIKPIRQQLLRRHHERHRQNQTPETTRAPRAPGRRALRFHRAFARTRARSLPSALDERRRIDAIQPAHLGRQVHAETAIEPLLLAAGPHAIVAERLGRRDRQIVLPGRKRLPHGAWNRAAAARSSKPARSARAAARRFARPGN